MEQGAAAEPIVVLAFDNSEHSRRAFEYYLREVHRPNYKLHVIHSTEAWPGVHPMDGGPSPGHAQELKDKDQHKVKEMEEYFKKQFQDNGIDGFFQVITGKQPWHQIVSYQEKVQAMMIVVGSRGLGSFRRTLMGSVSDDIVHHAHCPVLVCRH